MREQPLVFGCGGESLVGVLARPDAPDARGVLIVVGGPQYRAGSHRQFTLLARELARSGVASLRFDYRGMGDSSGPARSFEAVDEDIGCAVERLLQAVPELREVVIWGLCDAASAALFYAHRDARVSGVVLLNPWVRTEQGIAQAHLRHYYGRRLLDPGLWRKLFSGRLDLRATLASLRKFVADAASSRGDGGTLPERMEEALRRFRGRVLLILSGKDLTADEFRGVVSRSQRWTRLLADARVARRELADANHTFSRREWRDQVARWTAEWVKER
ncbi:MAG TPA: hydrolase 1, exosortase A system-associated [Burkholderiales bacterium]